MAKGGLRGLVFTGANGDEQAYKAAATLRKDFPTVAELLGGCPSEGELPAISPGAIVIHFHDGKWRFSCNVKSASLTFRGDIGDITNPWQSIELAFKTENVGKKAYTDPKNSREGEIAY